jgi:hypothetical protein
MELYKEMGFFDIILEGDALQVVNVVNMGSLNWSKMGHLIDGIKEVFG